MIQILSIWILCLLRHSRRYSICFHVELWLTATKLLKNWRFLGPFGTVIAVEIHCLHTFVCLVMPLWLCLKKKKQQPNNLRDNIFSFCLVGDSIGKQTKPQNKAKKPTKTNKQKLSKMPFSGLSDATETAKRACGQNYIVSVNGLGTWLISIYYCYFILGVEWGWKKHTWGR